MQGFVVSNKPGQIIELSSPYSDTKLSEIVRLVSCMGVNRQLLNAGSK